MTTGTTDQASQGNVAPLKTSRSYFQIVRENVFIPVNNFMLILGIALLLLPIGVYSLTGVVAVVWALTLRLIWRKRLLERFLQVDWSTWSPRNGGMKHATE